jgi:hypothetical protein
LSCYFCLSDCQGKVCRRRRQVIPFTLSLDEPHGDDQHSTVIRIMCHYSKSVIEARSLQDDSSLQFTQTYSFKINLNIILIFLPIVSKMVLHVRFYIRLVLFPSPTSRLYDIAIECVVRDRKQRSRELFSLLRTLTCEPRHKSESIWSGDT